MTTVATLLQLLVAVLLIFYLTLKGRRSRALLIDFLDHSVDTLLDMDERTR
jgi:hypothetical protein